MRRGDAARYFGTLCAIIVILRLNLCLGEEKPPPPQVRAFTLSAEQGNLHCITIKFSIVCFFPLQISTFLLPLYYWYYSIRIKALKPGCWFKLFYYVLTSEELRIEVEHDNKMYRFSCSFCFISCFLPPLLFHARGLHSTLQNDIADKGNRGDLRLRDGAPQEVRGGGREHRRLHVARRHHRRTRPLPFPTVLVSASVILSAPFSFPALTSACACSSQCCLCHYSSVVPVGVLLLSAPQVSGPCHAYVAGETPMVTYLNCHAVFEERRLVARTTQGQGPRVRAAQITHDFATRAHAERERERI